MSQQPAKRGQRLRTIRRTTTTGAVIVAAYMMFLMIPGGGGSGGSNESSSTAVTSTASHVSPSSPLASPLGAPTAVLAAQVGQSGENAPPEVIEGGVLTVVIDEYDYFVQTIVQDAEAERRELRPTTLEEIVKFADRASGDRNGIRVRVLRRDTARASAEAKLQTALQQRVNADAVYMAEELLP